MNTEEGADAETNRSEEVQPEQKITMEGETEIGDILSDGYSDPAQIREFESITAHHQQLREEGVLFVSSGNEPFWSFRLTGEERGVFSVPEGRFESRVETEHPNGERENPGTIYHSDETELRVRGEEGDSHDTM